MKLWNRKPIEKRTKYHTYALVTTWQLEIMSLFELSPSLAFWFISGSLVTHKTTFSISSKIRVNIPYKRFCCCRLRRYHKNFTKKYFKFHKSFLKLNYDKSLIARIFHSICSFIYFFLNLEKIVF